VHRPGLLGAGLLRREQFGGRLVSAACGCDEPTTSPADEAEEAERPWWRDPGLVVPILSGVAFGTGLALEWSGLHIAALVAFWAGLLLGAYTFVPGAIRNLVVKRKLGIALLMTISAVGAVILGYVEEAAALAVLYSIAEALEDKAMDRARGGLRALLKLVPETATVLRDGTSASVPAREIAVGDVLLVRPGERVATDGLVRSGRSSLDTSAITGESIPVEVAPGEAVSAGAINSAGVLEVEATAAGTDNSLTTIVELVEQAQAEKGDRARIADRIARPLAPGRGGAHLPRRYRRELQAVPYMPERLYPHVQRLKRSYLHPDERQPRQGPHPPQRAVFPAPAAPPRARCGALPEHQVRTHRHPQKPTKDAYAPAAEAPATPYRQYAPSHHLAWIPACRAPENRTSSRPRRRSA